MPDFKPLPIAFFVGTLVLAACSGGGGGGPSTPGGGGPGGPGGPTAKPGGPTPTPVPTATPTPKTVYVLPSAAAASTSVWAIDSQPHNLAVTLDGTSLGSTPASASPAYATTQHTIAIATAPGAPASTKPYTVSIAQTANGPHTIFYNAPIDTTGKIASISMATMARVRTFSAASHFIGVPRLATSSANRPRYSALRAVVRYDPARLDARRPLASLERAHGALLATTYAQSGSEITRLVTFAANTNVDAALAAMRKEPGVIGTDRIRLRYPLGAASAPVYPNDPFYKTGAQWYLDTIDATDAWSYGLGKPSVTIAIVDTGFDRAQSEVAPGVTFAETIVGGTLDASSTAAADTDGHGTFLSGVASAQTNNGAGFAGVAYGAALQEYKVFTDATSPTADSADIAEAIREAVAHGAKVVLLAVGAPADAGPDPLERDAIAFALSKNVTVVAAAGNEGASTLDFPAAYDGVIAVGASATNDTATPGSAFGNGNFEYVPSYANAASGGLVAPGGDPANATDPDPIHWIDNAYTTQPFAGNASCPSGTAPSDCNVRFSGTSPAAAQVAGAAALLLSQDATLAPGRIAALLEDTADDIKDARAGHGRLNLHNAMAALAGDLAPIPPPIAPVPSAFVAFAYDNAGGTKPHVLDVTYPAGAPVDRDGTFRIADVPVATDGTYKIAVWLDVNGDGIVDSGDYFGAVAARCAATGPCAGAGAIAVKRVPPTFVLP